MDVKVFGKDEDADLPGPPSELCSQSLRSRREDDRARKRGFDSRCTVHSQQDFNNTRRAAGLARGKISVRERWSRDRQEKAIVVLARDRLGGVCGHSGSYLVFGFLALLTPTTGFFPSNNDTACVFGARCNSSDHYINICSTTHKLGRKKCIVSLAFSDHSVFAQISR